MKITISIALFCFAAVAQLATANDKAKQVMLKKIEACAKEIGSSKEDINAIINKEDELTDSAKCLLACLMTKIGLIGADGKLSVDGAKKVAAAVKPGDTAIIDKAGAIANKCLSAAGPADSKCEAAHKYFHCSKQEMLAQGIQFF